MTARTQLVVLYHDHQHMYFPVGPDCGWKIDNASRCLVVGKFPRTYIPLDTVRSFDIEAIGGDAPEAAGRGAGAVNARFVVVHTDAEGVERTLGNIIYTDEGAASKRVAERRARALAEGWPDRYDLWLLVPVPTEVGPPTCDRCGERGGHARSCAPPERVEEVGR
ncbi:hypothetical protein [Dactylosporangium sp. CA-139066]|uniref:hypothetical protein n=1 Tax=Dactylosporangium sp. CA-139066 TaxID=3239930 RepID=UPI003D8BD86F